MSAINSTRTVTISMTSTLHLDGLTGTARTWIDGGILPIRTEHAALMQQGDVVDLVCDLDDMNGNAARWTATAIRRPVTTMVAVAL